MNAIRVFFDASGKVGVFDFESAEGSKLKNKKWQRVTITVQGRELATYIDGELCYQCQTLPAGTDGRFSIDPLGLQVFAASHPQHMPGGIHIRREDV